MIDLLAQNRACNWKSQARSIDAEGIMNSAIKTEFVMNLHQFRFVQEAVRRNLNLTEAAKALHTSQPGVSKAIIELEEELGVEIFARHGKRLKRVTEPGQHVLASIELIMREVGNLKRIGEQFSAQDSGTLSIATTHTQARYVLPVPVAKLREAYPKVNVSLHQGSPDQVARMVIDEIAEIGIATESLADYADLVTLPCYEWQHVLVLPQGPSAGGQGARHAGRPGGRADHHLPPVVHRPHAHRPRLRAEEAHAAHRAGSDRLRRDQDLCAAGPGHRHRGRDGGARRRATPTWWCGRWATCSARTSRASPSSAAPTCATSSSSSPSC